MLHQKGQDERRIYWKKQELILEDLDKDHTDYKCPKCERVLICDAR